MAAKKSPQDVSAMAFFNMASEYHDAAKELFMIADTRAKIRGQMPPLSNPLSLLYFHTAELALKAFLRAKNIPILNTHRQSHKLSELYAESRDLGLVIGPDDRSTIGNIVELLDSGNKYQGFRYFNLESTSTADLSWVREVIEQLMRAVEPHALARQQQDKAALGAAKLILSVSKPTPKII